MKLEQKCEVVLVGKKEQKSTKNEKVYYSLGIAQNGETGNLQCSQEVYEKCTELYKPITLLTAYGENQYGKFINVIDVLNVSDPKQSAK